MSETNNDTKKYFKVLCSHCGVYIKYTYEEMAEGRTKGFLICKNCQSQINVK